MNAWWFAAVGAGWMLIHFAAYAVWLRFAASLRSEQGVFAFQAGSFAVILALAGVAFICRPTHAMFAAAILVVAIHGIYSLSFLELWSLTEGGYSLQLLNSTANPDATPKGLPRALELGSFKINQRLESLSRLSFVREKANNWSLTPNGNRVAFVLSALLRITNGRSINR